MIDLENYCENWQKARIKPKQKIVEQFIKERTQSIKRLMSTANTNNHHKAVKEEEYLRAIIDLDTEYQEFLKSVSAIVWKCIQQYANQINDGGEIVKENNFLRDRLEKMDERELTYLQLLAKAHERS